MVEYEEVAITPGCLLCFSKAKGKTLKIPLTVVDMKNIHNSFRLKMLHHNYYNFENGINVFYLIIKVDH